MLRRGSRTRTSAVVLAALAAALAAATSATARPQLSKPQYITRADAICSSAAAQVRRLGRASTRQRAASLAGRWLAIDRRALARIRSLSPPASDRATIKHVIALATTAINTGLAGAFAAAKSGSDSRYRRAVQRFLALQKAAHAAARAYGFKACSTW